MKKLLLFYTFLLLILLLIGGVCHAQNPVQVSQPQWFLKYIKIGPSTTATRPAASTCNFCMEYNTDSLAYEFSNGVVWRSFGGGNTGSTGIDTIYQHGDTLLYRKQGGSYFAGTFITQGDSAIFITPYRLTDSLMNYVQLRDSGSFYVTPTQLYSYTFQNSLDAPNGSILNHDNYINLRGTSLALDNAGLFDLQVYGEDQNNSLHIDGAGFNLANFYGKLPGNLGYKGSHQYYNGTIIGNGYQGANSQFINVDSSGLYLNANLTEAQKQGESFVYLNVPHNPSTARLTMLALDTVSASNDPTLNNQFRVYHIPLGSASVGNADSLGHQPAGYYAPSVYQKNAIPFANPTTGQLMADTAQFKFTSGTTQPQFLMGDAYTAQGIPANPAGIRIIGSNSNIASERVGTQGPTLYNAWYKTSTGNLSGATNLIRGDVFAFWDTHAWVPASTFHGNNGYRGTTLASIKMQVTADSLVKGKNGSAMVIYTTGNIPSDTAVHVAAVFNNYNAWLNSRTETYNNVITNRDTAYRMVVSGISYLKDTVNIKNELRLDSISIRNYTIGHVYNYASLINYNKKDTLLSLDATDGTQGIFFLSQTIPTGFQVDTATVFPATGVGAGWYWIRQIADQKIYSSWYRDTANYNPTTGAGNNDAVNISRAISYTPFGYTLVLRSGGIYGLKSTLNVTDKNIIIDLNNSTIYQTANARLFTVTNSTLRNDAVSNFAVVDTVLDGGTQKNRVVRITIGSTPASNYKRGDLVKIVANNNIPGTYANSDGSVARVGQFIHVAAIANGNLYMTCNVLYSDSFKTSVSVYLFDTTKYFELKNGNLKSVQNGDVIGITNSFIQVNNSVNTRIHEITTSMSWGSFAEMVGCYSYNIYNCIDGNERTQASTRIGYGIRDYGSQFSITHDCVGYDIRHLYTTNQQYNTTASTPDNYGNSIYNTVSDCVTYGANNAGFDTHAASDYITFNNCRAIGTYAGNSSNGDAFIVRGNHTVLNNCEGDGLTGLHIYTDSAYCIGTVINGGRFKGIVNAVKINRAATAFNADSTIIQNTVLSCDSTVLTSIIGSKVTLLNNTYNIKGNSNKVIIDKVGVGNVSAIGGTVNNTNTGKTTFLWTEAASNRTLIKGIQYNGVLDTLANTRNFADTLQIEQLNISNNYVEKVNFTNLVYNNYGFYSPNSVSHNVMAGDLTTSEYKLSALNTAPASSTDTGTTGEIRITASYIYVCTATNTWVRTPLSTW